MPYLKSQANYSNIHTENKKYFYPIGGRKSI